MTLTPNYGLNKPEGSDYAKIAALNENADILDAALGTLARAPFSQRPRDPALPNYGLWDGAITLRTASYTGLSEIALQVESDLYDAENMTARPETAPSGTIIIRKVED